MMTGMMEMYSYAGEMKQNGTDGTDEQDMCIR